MNKTAMAILAALCASIALADDFKPIDGKEYKDAKVSRVEPDGIVLTTQSGISELFLTELPNEAQERSHSNPAQAAAQSVQPPATLTARTLPRPAATANAT